MTKTLFVGNLPWATTEEDLRRIFSAHVEVKNARIISERETGRSRGFGFVEVEDGDAPKALQALSGFVMNGREIVVNEARPKQSKY
ncbi:MAG: RNA-binding protein [Firmicutes bacterium]|nr:RNA-binding protein [Bacillota bacterium]MCL5038610.1 RNA-binding protein [Bacillota bacterium]